MIVLFSGLPGSGKSYKMVSEVWNERNKYFIIHNIVGFKTDVLQGFGFNWIDYINEQKIEVDQFFSKEYQAELSAKIKEKYKRPMLIIIDESHEWFDRNVKTIKMWLSYHRHLSQKIYLVAHASKNIPQTYRSFIEVEFRAKSSSFIFLPGYFFYNRIIGGQRAGYMLERKKKEIFNLYNSFDVNTNEHKKRKSLVIPSIVMLIVLGVVGFLSLPKFLGWKMKGNAQAEVKSEVKSSVVEVKENEFEKYDKALLGRNDVEKIFCYIGQFNGEVVVEDRRTGRQYRVKDLPEKYKSMNAEGVTHGVIASESEIYELTNYARYVVPEVRQQRTDGTTIDSENKNLTNIEGYD